MPFIESSKDILYIVIAFCVLWLTIFISWMMFYCITIIKQVNGMVKDVRMKLELIESFIHLMKEKVEKSSSYLFIIAEFVKHAGNFFIKKKLAINETNTTKKRKK